MSEGLGEGLGLKEWGSALFPSLGPTELGILPTMTHHPLADGFGCHLIVACGAKDVDSLYPQNKLWGGYHIPSLQMIET